VEVTLLALVCGQEAILSIEVNPNALKEILKI
jgi:hypothetical protein